MDNIALLKFEIILLLIFLLYCIYYLLEYVLDIFIRLKSLICIKKYKKNSNQAVAKIKIEENKNLDLNQYKKLKETISEENKNKISELLKKIDLNIAKAEYDLAKNLIIEGLTIDKFNIELNLELASIYILEKDYIKAEYIYKDLLLVHEEDFEILKKLAYVLSMQEKYDLALEMYKKAYDIKNDDFEVVNMLAHLYYFKKMYLESIGFLKILLKQNMKDVENLILLGLCYRSIGKYNDAINTFKRVLDIQPYNEEVKNEIQDIQKILQEEKK